MINKSKWLLIAFVMLASGCAMFQWRKAEIYPMSYDQTYDVVMSALDDMEPWKLMQTDPSGSQSSPLANPSRTSATTSTPLRS